VCCVDARVQGLNLILEGKCHLKSDVQFTIEIFWQENSSGSSGIPRNFVRGGGLTNSVEDREKGDL